MTYSRVQTVITQEQATKISAYTKARKHINALLFSSEKNDRNHKFKE